MSWVLLLIAGLLEVAWAVGLKYSEGFTKLVPSVLTAGAILVTIPAMIVFLFAQRYLISGLTRGGVKG